MAWPASPPGVDVQPEAVRLPPHRQDAGLRGHQRRSVLDNSIDGSPIRLAPRREDCSHRSLTHPLFQHRQVAPKVGLCLPDCPLGILTKSRLDEGAGIKASRISLVGMLSLSCKVNKIILYNFFNYYKIYIIYLNLILISPMSVCSNCVRLQWFWIRPPLKCWSGVSCSDTVSFERVVK